MNIIVLRIWLGQIAWSIISVTFSPDLVTFPLLAHHSPHPLSWLWGTEEGSENLWSDTEKLNCGPELNSTVRYETQPHSVGTRFRPLRTRVIFHGNN